MSDPITPDEFAYSTSPRTEFPGAVSPKSGFRRP